MKMRSFGLILVALLGACTDPSVPSGTNARGLGPAIFGGEVIDFSDPVARSTVAVFKYEIKAFGRVKIVQRCTGSLIKDEVVVTAAHCVADFPPGIRGGNYVMFVQDVEPDRTAENSRDVVRAEVHPEFPTLSHPVAQTENLSPDKDLAFLKLSAPAPTGFRPARLLSDSSLLIKGQVITIAGFGLQKMTANERVLDGLLRKTQTVIQGSFRENEVLSDQSAGHGFCLGDSGGPAFVEVDGEVLLWGVASQVFFYGEASCTHAGVHTSLIAHRKFMEQALALLQAR